MTYDAKLDEVLASHTGVHPMSTRDELRKLLELGGDTYSSAEVFGLVGRAADEIERLRAALRPFARYYDLNDCDGWHPQNCLEVPLGDLKVARDLLRDEQSVPEGDNDPNGNRDLAREIDGS